MGLLAVVMLFLFVYAPNPVEPPGIELPLPDFMDNAVNTSIEGWKDLIETFSDLNNNTYS